VVVREDAVKVFSKELTSTALFIRELFEAGVEGAARRSAISPSKSSREEKLRYTEANRK
jgi:intracellular sulfur oxidation DsrE/DsrF family protein